MGSNTRVKYNADIVMCIDATDSMSDLIHMVKENALNFYKDLTAVMEEKGKHVDELRVRVITFRDYLADGENAMLATDFYTLPAQEAEFSRVVNSIQAFGGGDDPEDGLEALAYAINSKWTKRGDKQRHIIVIWSDEETHPLGFGAKAPNYPNKMARDFDELTKWWGDPSFPGLMDNFAKRLLIYAPDMPYWNDITASWDNVLHFPSIAGQGLRELEYQEVLNALANTI